MAKISNLNDILFIACETFDEDQPTRRGLRHYLTHAHALIFLLKSPKGENIGYVHIEANERTKSVYVNTTVIRPAWRGKGLGAVLFALHDDMAEAFGFHTIRMHISESAQNNLHMARKNGYEEIWFGQYLDDGSNSYLMRKRFKKP